MKIIRDYNEVKLDRVVAVVSANYLGGNVLEISFNDGVNKLIDFKPFLLRSRHPSISKYLNENLFKQFKVDNGNLNWNDYDLIFPVHDLYTGVVE